MPGLPPVHEEDASDPITHVGAGTVGLAKDSENWWSKTDDAETVQDNAATKPRRRAGDEIHSRNNYHGDETGTEYQNGSVDEIHACKAIKKITWLHKQIRQRIPYKLMKMNLKKWTVRIIQDLEPIVKKHQERIRLSNKLKVLK